jgi:uncharacterized membrane protein
MNTTAIPLSRPQLSAFSRSTARLPDFVALMKPRVMALAVFTAIVGLAIAPGHLDPLLAAVAVLGIAVGAGAAGALNMWYDADIDAVMARTARRPIPRGRISRAEALVFGLVLAGGAVATLALAVNVQAAALLAFTIFFYIAVYTAWLKRSTPQNIVIGAAACDRLGGRHRRARARAAHFVPDHFPVDATALLGAGAQSERRLLPCRHPHAAGRCRESRDDPADRHLHGSFGPDFDVAVGAGVCQHDLRRGRRHGWRAVRRSCLATATGQRGGSATRLPSLCVFHCLPVCTLCGAVGRQ